MTGEIDLVAMCACASTRGGRRGRGPALPGVLRTETHIAFRTFSKHDLEAAFALGAGDSD